MAGRAGERDACVDGIPHIYIFFKFFGEKNTTYQSAKADLQVQSGYFG